MWLSDDAKWPTNITTSASSESQAEKEILKDIFKFSEVRRDELEVLVKRFQFWKVVRVCAWIARFTDNAKKSKKNRLSGPLTTGEIEKQVMWWVKRTQENVQYTEVQLKLQPNDEGIMECRGLIQRQYPIYLPDCHEFTLHLKTMHGGIRATMTQVRERYWVPQLRRLARKVTKSCYGGYQFQAKAFADPPPAGKLPTDRTEGSEAFEVVGVDFPGPLKCQKSKSQEGKAYLIAYACSLTRGVHIEVLTTMETTEFLGSLNLKSKNSK